MKIKLFLQKSFDPIMCFIYGSNEKRRFFVLWGMHAQVGEDSRLLLSFSTLVLLHYDVKPFMNFTTVKQGATSSQKQK